MPASFPTTHQQRFVLDSIERPTATATYRLFWSIPSALRVKPGLDPRRAERALKELARRHDALRMRYTKENGEWRAVIEDEHPSGLVVHDARDWDEAQLNDCIDRLATEEFDLENGSLFRLHLFRCGKDGDVVFANQHHVSTDGWSVIVLVEEFVLLVLGLPLPGPRPPSYSEYLAGYEFANRPDDQQVRTYWRDLLLPAVPTLKLGRFSKGYEPNLTEENSAPTEQLSIMLSAACSARIDAIAKKANASQHNTVMAAYASTLAERADVDELYLISATSNRTAVELARYVGCIVHMMPVRCEVKRKTLSDFAAEIGRQTRASLAKLHPYATSRDSEMAAEVMRQGGCLGQLLCNEVLPESLLKKSMVGAGFMKGVGSITRSGSVSIERLPLRQNRMTAREIDLRVQSVDGRQMVRLSYDMLAFSREEAEEILRDLAGRLGDDDEDVGKIAYQGRFGAPADLAELDETGTLSSVRRYGS